MKCLLDMDGVLVDFVSGVCRCHNLPYIYDDPKMIGKWNFTIMYGQKFWEPFEEEFWANLEPMQDCFEIVTIIETFFKPEDICILSSPSRNYGCIPGKLKWLERHLPQYCNKFLMGARKEFCAHSSSILIDDADHNVNKFKQNGGNGILLPRIWNSLHGLRHNVLEHLVKELQCVRSSICPQVR